MGYVFTDEVQPASQQPTKGYVFEDEAPQAVPGEKKGLWSKIVGTAERMAAGVNSGAAELHRKVFGKRSENFERNTEWWRQKAERNGITRESLTGKVAEGVGTVPGAIPEWLPTPAGVAVGTALSASGGYQDAKESGENPILGAVKGAGKHLLFRGAFKVIEKIPVTKALPKTAPPKVQKVTDVGVKATAMGGLMAGDALHSGGNATDATAAFIIGAGLPLVQGAARKSEAKLPEPDLNELLTEQGLEPEVVTHLETKAKEIEPKPENLEVFTEQLDKIIDTHRQIEAVETPVPEAKPTETKVPEGFYEDQYKFTPEERQALSEKIDKIIDGEGKVDPEELDSLINLRRVGATDAETLNIIQATGEAVRQKVAERLGTDTGKQEVIMEQVNEAIIRKIEKETGLDILSESALATANLEQIRVQAQITRAMMDKYAILAKEAAERANLDNAPPEAVAYSEYMQDMLAQYVGKNAELGRLASWLLNDRKIIPDAEAVLGVKELTYEDFANNPAMVTEVMKNIEGKGGLEAAKRAANEYLKAGDLAGRLAKVKLRDKASIWNTIFEFSSFNMLSSIYGRAKDFFHNIVRPFSDDTEVLGGAILTGGKGISFREAGYRFYGDFQGTLEALTRGWEGVREIPHPGLREFLRSPIDTLYHSIEQYEGFVDDLGFMHGRTKATLEGAGKKYLSSAYISTTGTGKVFNQFLEGVGKIVGMGDSVKDIAHKIIDLHGMVGRSMVFGAMKYTDLPSEYMGYNAEAYGLAARETVKLGLKGKEAAKAIEDIVTIAKAHRDGIKLPESPEVKKWRVEGKRIHEAAMKYASERTLKQEFESKYAKELEGFVNHTAAGKAVKIVAGQYFSTPARLFKYTADRTVPGFLLSKVMRESVMGMRGPEAQALALSKLAFGTLAQATAAYLISNGTITLLSPVSERKTWRDAGVLEVAININGRLYKVAPLQPYGDFLSMVVDAYTGYQTAKNEDQNPLWTITQAAIHDATQRSYLKSLFDLKSAAEGDPDALHRFMMGQGAKLIPYSGLLSSATDMYGNGEVRAVDNPTDLIAKVYNPSSLDIAPDQFGKPRSTTDRFFGVPTAVPAKDGTARAEVVRLGVRLPDAPKILPLELGDFTKYGYKMTELERRDYMRSLANDPINMEETMQRVIDSPGYQEAPDREKKRLLQEVVTISHGIAKDLLYKKPEVMEAARKQGIAVTEWYSNKAPIPTQENWMEYLTDGKVQERKVMHKYGLIASEGGR